MKVAILTGGGDCPGLNAVIRAVVRRGEQHGFEFVGVRDGWKGLLEDDHFRLTRDKTSGILQQGGTILGTSRTNPFKRPEGPGIVMETLARHNIQAVVAVGGEDTLGVAKRFFDLGMKVVGVPKTIDNDLSGTDYTFGFDTAVAVATDAVDRLHTTAEAHSRVIVCEVMGRHAGHIALHSGLAGGADVILIPERPIVLGEVCSLNVTLLGAMSTVLDIPQEHWLAAIHANLAQKLHKINEQAFALGRQAAEARREHAA